MQTNQLLLTVFITVEDGVLGKYSALLCIFAISVGASCLCPLLIQLRGITF